MTTFTPPTKVCPNCGAQAQTTEDRCPNCNKKYRQKKSHTVRNVLLGIVLLGLLFIAGCVALIGGVANEVGQELDAQQAESAISQEDFDAIQVGSTRAQVDEIVAPATPQDAQEFEQEGVLDEENIQSSCIYFNREGGEFGDIYQLCFNGSGPEATVSSKNSY